MNSKAKWFQRGGGVFTGLWIICINHFVIAPDSWFAQLPPRQYMAAGFGLAFLGIGIGGALLVIGFVMERRT